VWGVLVTTGSNIRGGRQIKGAGSIIQMNKPANTTNDQLEAEEIDRSGTARRKPPGSGVNQPQQILFRVYAAQQVCSWSDGENIECRGIEKRGNISEKSAIGELTGQPSRLRFVNAC
jgi:hypothetical protein